MKRSRIRLFKWSKRILICTIIFTVVGNIYLASCEIKVNSDSKKTENKIAKIKSDIDGLEIKKSELASFSRLKKIASSKGYTYKQGSTAATVVSDE